MHKNKVPARSWVGTFPTGIAQLVEHWSPKPGVGSSSLSSRAKIEIMDLIKYCKDSYSELVHNTTWPNRRELMHSAIVVLVASILIAIVVFAEDTLFERIMNLVYQR